MRKLLIALSLSCMFTINARQLTTDSTQFLSISKAQYAKLMAFVNKVEVDATSGATLKSTTNKQKRKLQLGGYGEATMSRMFYSNNYKRYSNASLYKEAPGYGQFDLPHVVFFVSYDFGKGWKFSSEIEFEHGGTESAVEIEEEETGEYESEVERGGEVALEQFWIEKSFCNALNLRMGHIIVPIGLTNAYHLPTQFFSVYRPEGESAIMPCTWHETGVSLWGNVKNWRYELQFLAGLDAERFGSKNWIKDGAGSPYEFKLATCYAGAFRIDNYTLPGLRVGVSGYIGNSAANSLKPDGYSNINGTVTIGAVDFHYEGHNWILRGNYDYGNLTDSRAITAANLASRKASPSPKTPVASDAMCSAVEAGYDLFSQIQKMHKRGHKLYLFGRYDYYDTMFKTAPGIVDNDCWERHCISGGVNYFPIKNIVIKAEYSSRLFHSKYNDENTLSLGVAYAGNFSF